MTDLKTRKLRMKRLLLRKGEVEKSKRKAIYIHTLNRFKARRERKEKCDRTRQEEN